MIKVELLNTMGTDLDVVNAARVSFHKESEFENKEFQILSSDDKKLIKYLAKHKHKSPFNHAFLKFRVKAPIFVARQLVKHEYLCWNEVSRRYVTDEPEFYLPEVWRKKADNVKQGSSDEAVENVFSASTYYAMSLSLYNQMLEAGVCPEQARMVLPQSMMTEWIWSGSLYAFSKMAILRTDPHTQKECRDVAEEVAKHLKLAFPESYKALKEFGV